MDPDPLPFSSMNVYWQRFLLETALWRVAWQCY